MGRRDAGGDRGPRRGAPPLLLTGSAFLHNPFGSSVFAGGGRHPGTGGRSLGLARRVLDWGRDASRGTVTCIACGTAVAREDAREYDKHGDRFDRRDKEFEHLCKRCHRDLDRKPRRDLEATLVEFEATDRPREEFLAWYCGRVEERDGPGDGE